MLLYFIVSYTEGMNGLRFWNLRINGIKDGIYWLEMQISRHRDIVGPLDVSQQHCEDVYDS